MAQGGADILDVGGESTRPGAAPVDAEEERRRVLPVIRRLARELAIPISIDTYKAEVAEAAIKAGHPTGLLVSWRPRRPGCALAAFEGRLYLFGGWDGRAYRASAYRRPGRVGY